MHSFRRYLSSVYCQNAVLLGGINPLVSIMQSIIEMLAEVGAFLDFLLIEYELIDIKTYFVVSLLFICAPLQTTRLIF